MKNGLPCSARLSPKVEPVQKGKLDIFQEGIGGAPATARVSAWFESCFLVGGIPGRETFLAQFHELRKLGQVGMAMIGDGKVFACYCQTHRTEDEPVAATMLNPGGHPEADRNCKCAVERNPGGEERIRLRSYPKTCVVVI